MLRRDVQMHGCAQKSLQQSVVKLLRDPSSLRQPFLKPQIHLSGQLDHSYAHKRKNCESYRQRKQKPETPCLPIHRLDLEADNGFIVVPNAVCIARDYPEAINARIQIRVDRFADGTRATPIRI